MGLIIKRQVILKLATLKEVVQIVTMHITIIQTMVIIKMVKLILNLAVIKPSLQHTTQTIKTEKIINKLLISNVVVPRMTIDSLNIYSFYSPLNLIKYKKLIKL